MATGVVGDPGGWIGGVSTEAEQVFQDSPVAAFPADAEAEVGLSPEPDSGIDFHLPGVGVGLPDGDRGSFLEPGTKKTVVR